MAAMDQGQKGTRVPNRVFQSETRRGDARWKTFSFLIGEIWSGICSFLGVSSFLSAFPFPAAGQELPGGLGLDAAIAGDLVFREVGSADTAEWFSSLDEADENQAHQPSEPAWHQHPRREAKPERGSP